MNFEQPPHMKSAPSPEDVSIKIQRKLMLDEHIDSNEKAAEWISGHAPKIRQFFDANPHLLTEYEKDPAAVEAIVKMLVEGESPETVN